MDLITEDDLRDHLADIPATVPPGTLERLTTNAVLQGRARRRRRRTAGAGATLTAVLAITVVTLTSGLAAPTPSGTNPSTSEAGGTLLLSLAAHVEKLPDQVTNAPYWYVKAQYSMDDPNHPRTGPHSVQQLWQGHHRGSVERWNNDFGTTKSGPYRVQLGDGTSLTWDQLGKLPTDPHALRAWVDRHDGPDPKGGSDQRTRAEARFGIVSTLLGQGPTSPALRAALYQVLANLPGTDVRHGHDALGRDALVVSYQRPESDPEATAPETDQYYVSPSSGALLEEEVLNADQDHTAHFWTTYLASGPVPDDHTVALASTSR